MEDGNQLLCPLANYQLCKSY